MARVGAVVVAAGSSTRAGEGTPKQFRMLGAKPMFVAAVEPLLGECDEIVVVVPGGSEKRAASMLRAAGLPDAGVRFVAGGERRHDSVGRGLDALSPDVEIVIVHDAARPFASAGLVARVVAAAAEHGAAIPVIPVTDSVKRVDAGAVVASLDRSVLWLSQTPQGFRREVLEHARELCVDAEVTDDAQCVEMSGHPVAVVEGEPGNVKLTHASDLEVAGLRVGRATGLDRPARVGIGSDLHRLVAGRKLVLCGVEIPFDKGLDGWSDADVATHAVMDALLGAVAERDIGHHFPPGDEEHRDASSIGLLRKVVKLLRSRGYTPSSIDVTIVAEAPRLSLFVEDMRRALADATGLALREVSVKATTTEGTGAEGAGEAISASAVAVVRPTGYAEGE